MFVCSDLACERGGRLLFKGLSFELAAGDVIVIHGANGSGKTSLIRMLCGLLAPKQGEILWERQPITFDFEGYHSQMVYIGHKNGIKKYQTVHDNLIFWKQIFLKKTSQMSTISSFGLDKVADLPCYILSAGWQRRVALAKLNIVDAQLWLLDEPLTHLDSEGRELFRKNLKNHQKNGGMAVIADHADLKIGKELHLEAFIPRGEKE